MLELSAKQFRELCRLIGTAYPSAAALRQLLMEHLGENLDAITHAAPLPEQVTAVVLRANSAGWLPDLVSALKADRPRRLDIQAFTLPSVGVSPSEGDPYQAHVVRSARILVNRKELRSAVRDLEERDAYRFLVITGGDQMGKSYSRQFITHVCERLRTFRLGSVNLVELHDAVRGPLKPEPVAERVFSHLRLDTALIPAKNHEKYERWSQRVCDVLLRVLPTETSPPQLPTWLVFDGFNSVPLDDGTIAFVQELARQVEATFTHLRLVLLGWPGQLPCDVEQTARRETLAPLSNEDLCDFFEKVHRRRSPGLDEHALAREVAASVAVTRGAARDGMPGINAVLGQAAAEEWRRLESRP